MSGEPAKTIDVESYEQRARAALVQGRLFAAAALILLLAWPFGEALLPEFWQFAGDLVMPLALVAAAFVFVGRSRRAHVQVEQARLAEAEVRAHRDELSGLLNVGAFRQRLRGLVADCARDGGTFALVALDLDNFKQINDRFGHVAGDEMIAAIGAAISSSIADDCVAARPAGDEFALLLPNAGKAEARATAERVADAIAAASLAALPRNQHVAVSASYGIALYPVDGADAEALTSGADRALHGAKVAKLGDLLRTDERSSQDVFFAIGEAIGQSLDPQQMVDNFCRAVAQSLRIDTAGIWLVQDNDSIEYLSGYAADAYWARRVQEIGPMPRLTATEGRQAGMIAGHPVYIDDAFSSAAIPDRFKPYTEAGAWFITAPISGERSMLVLSGRHALGPPPETGLVLAIARQAASALRNADAYQRARRQKEQLAALAGLGGFLIGDGDFEDRLGLVTRTIVEVTGFDTVTIDTEDPTGSRPFIRQFFGRNPDGQPMSDAQTRLWRTMRPALTEPAVSEFLAQANRPIVMEDPVRQVPEMYREIIAESGLRSVVVMPITWQAQLVGLMYVSAYRAHAFDEQDVMLMQTIAAQLAPSLQVASLHVALEQSYAELKDAHLQALLRLAYAAEARDPYTECHLQRIRAIAQAVAERMGVECGEREALGYGAVVHDLGKLRIPDSILMNPGSLSDDEWAQMKKHPEWGAEIIGDNAFYDVARQVALNHHERWDGSGYPRGIAGEEIPLAARIVSVADVYDALTSARPYKAAWASERALVELMRMRGRTLCPRCVDTFMELWREGEISRIDEETLNDSMELDFRLYAA